MLAISESEYGNSLAAAGFGAASRRLAEALAKERSEASILPGLAQDESRVLELHEMGPNPLREIRQGQDRLEESGQISRLGGMKSPRSGEKRRGVTEGRGGRGPRAATAKVERQPIDWNLSQLKEIVEQKRPTKFN